NRYTQAVGWVNANSQYVPGAGLVSNRWDNYYNFLAQYREFEKIYNKQSQDDQELRRIFMIAATIYLYDHTQKVVDLHGDIPFSEAGMLSVNGGDYEASLPKYDPAETIYSTMLDNLKAFADELNGIEITSAIQKGFKTQDIINNGDLGRWQAYCNSLRLRMLMRVSESPAFQSRANSEIQTIIANPSDYPLVTDNADNIQIEVFDLNTAINAKGFRAGLEDWQGNLAGKAMIDQMVSTDDPRLRVIFEPGPNAAGVYTGLDPTLDGSDQQELADGGTIAIYNRSTFSRNEYFPGMLISAAEVNLLLAEYHLRTGNDALAKTAYNNAIEQSILQYYAIRSVSNDNTAGAVDPVEDAEIALYQNDGAVAWDLALNANAKLELIATQKWLHFNVVQSLEGWAEQRRLGLPALDFWVDESNAQELPPNRWLYAPSENTYNTINYDAVRAKDNLATRIFWDVD
ncbi:MAG TPA: SusD/RagB family nutrient-binding outer membrane lipoprotein, partial [Chryseosolibacter sp.]|nr:SusD/RagB family nutrient-binding outer membrane lipoprotein [Chryseosolibacter sp.]